ncbi:hypothetical protein H9P43_007244 [Blastocladiella emersonii ATCC 22665]|nr:hypothetical protein H9P43_007244 [Blastocladiella emersonii ATCC 22665]
MRLRSAAPVYSINLRIRHVPGTDPPTFEIDSPWFDSAGGTMPLVSALVSPLPLRPASLTLIRFAMRLPQLLEEQIRAAGAVARTLPANSPVPSRPARPAAAAAAAPVVIKTEPMAPASNDDVIIDATPTSADDEMAVDPTAPAAAARPATAPTASNPAAAAAGTDTPKSTGAVSAANAFTSQSLGMFPRVAGPPSVASSSTATGPAGAGANSSAAAYPGAWGSLHSPSANSSSGNLPPPPPPGYSTGLKRAGSELGHADDAGHKRLRYDDLDVYLTGTREREPNGTHVYCVKNLPDDAEYRHRLGDFFRAVGLNVTYCRWNKDPDDPAYMMNFAFVEVRDPNHTHGERARMLRERTFYGKVLRLYKPMEEVAIREESLKGLERAAKYSEEVRETREDRQRRYGGEYAASEAGDEYDRGRHGHPQHGPPHAAPNHQLHQQIYPFAQHNPHGHPHVPHGYPHAHPGSPHAGMGPMGGGGGMAGPVMSPTHSVHGGHGGGGPGGPAPIMYGAPRAPSPNASARFNAAHIARFRISNIPASKTYSQTLRGLFSQAGEVKFLHWEMPEIRTERTASAILDLVRNSQSTRRMMGLRGVILDGRPLAIEALDVQDMEFVAVRAPVVFIVTNIPPTGPRVALLRQVFATKGYVHYVDWHFRRHDRQCYAFISMADDPSLRAEDLEGYDFHGSLLKVQRIPNVDVFCSRPDLLEACLAGVSLTKAIAAGPSGSMALINAATGGGGATRSDFTSPYARFNWSTPGWPGAPGGRDRDGPSVFSSPGASSAIPTPASAAAIAAAMAAGPSAASLAAAAAANGGMGGSSTPSLPLDSPIQNPRVFPLGPVRKQFVGAAPAVSAITAAKAAAQAAAAKASAAPTKPASSDPASETTASAFASSAPAAAVDDSDLEAGELPDAEAPATPSGGEEAAGEASAEVVMKSPAAEHAAVATAKPAADAAAEPPSLASLAAMATAELDTPASSTSAAPTSSGAPAVAAAGDGVAAAGSPMDTAEALLTLGGGSGGSQQPVEEPMPEAATVKAEVESAAVPVPEPVRAPSPPAILSDPVALESERLKYVVFRDIPAGVSNEVLISVISPYGQAARAIRDQDNVILQFEDMTQAFMVAVVRELHVGGQDIKGEIVSIEYLVDLITSGAITY